MGRPQAVAWHALALAVLVAGHAHDLPDEWQTLQTLQTLALAVDDECLAEGAPCALNALQLRGVQLQAGELHDPDTSEDSPLDDAEKDTQGWPEVPDSVGAAKWTTTTIALEPPKEASTPQSSADRIKVCQGIPKEAPLHGSICVDQFKYHCCTDTKGVYQVCKRVWCGRGCRGNTCVRPEYVTMYDTL